MGRTGYGQTWCSGIADGRQAPPAGLCLPPAGQMRVPFAGQKAFPVRGFLPGTGGGGGGVDISRVLADGVALSLDGQGPTEFVQTSFPGSGARAVVPTMTPHVPPSPKHGLRCGAHG